MDSILNSIKKPIGLSADYAHYDEDLIMSINTIFGKLSQLGIGPAEGFEITGPEETWSSYASNLTPAMEKTVRSYVYLKVKLEFDPPTSSNVTAVIEKSIAELEWRMYVDIDNKI